MSGDKREHDPSGEWYFVVCVDGSFEPDPDDDSRDWEFTDVRDAMDVAQDRRDLYGDDVPVSVMPYRREDGHAGILALIAALGWAVILLALWTVTGDAIAGSSCAPGPIAS